MICNDPVSARPCFNVRFAGYSLLEILIVVALIGIILAYAVPSYQQYLQRVHRADAVRTLLSIAGCQERIRAKSGFYDTTRCLGEEPQARYAFSMEPEDKPSSLTFRAIARPIRASANDPCGTLSITQTGSRSISGDLQYRMDCWTGR